MNVRERDRTRSFYNSSPWASGGSESEIGSPRPKKPSRSAITFAIQEPDSTSPQGKPRSKSFFPSLQQHANCKVLKCGVLWKQSRHANGVFGGKRWKQRFFVLTPLSFDYYENEKKRKPMHSFAVTDIVDFYRVLNYATDEDCEEIGPMSSFIFRIETLEGRLHCCAENWRTIRGWMDALSNWKQRATLRLQGRRPTLLASDYRPDSSRRGTDEKGKQQTVQRVEWHLSGPSQKLLDTIKTFAIPNAPSASVLSSIKCTFALYTVRSANESEIDDSKSEFTAWRPTWILLEPQALIVFHPNIHENAKPLLKLGPEDIRMLYSEKHYRELCARTTPSAEKISEPSGDECMYICMAAKSCSVFLGLSTASECEEWLDALFSWCDRRDKMKTLLGSSELSRLDQLVGGDRNRKMKIVSTPLTTDLEKLRSTLEEFVRTRVTSRTDECIGDLEWDDTELVSPSAASDNSKVQESQSVYYNIFHSGYASFLHVLLEAMESGMLMYGAGKYDLAEVCFSRATTPSVWHHIESRKSFPTIFVDVYTCGLCIYARLLAYVRGNFDRAKDMYSLSRSLLAPRTAGYMFCSRDYALMLYSRRRHEEALRLLTDLAEMYPSDCSLAYDVFFVEYQMRKDLAVARSRLETCLSTDASYFPAVYSYACLLRELGSSDDVCHEWFERAASCALNGTCMQLAIVEVDHYKALKAALLAENERTFERIRDVVRWVVRSMESVCELSRSAKQLVSAEDFVESISNLNLSSELESSGVNSPVAQSDAGSALYGKRLMKLFYEWICHEPVDLLTPTSVYVRSIELVLAMKAVDLSSHLTVDFVGMMTELKNSVVEMFHIFGAAVFVYLLGMSILPSERLSFVEKGFVQTYDVAVSIVHVVDLLQHLMSLKWNGGEVSASVGANFLADFIERADVLKAHVIQHRLTLLIEAYQRCEDDFLENESLSSSSFGGNDAPARVASGSTLAS